MNSLDMILLTLIIILALILLNFVLKYKKLKGDGQLSISKQITEFSQLIINITNEVMKLNSLTQEEFSNEEEFRKVLAGMVIEELNATITNEDINTKYKFINELSDSEIEQLVLNIFALYKKEIGIMEFISDTAHFVFNDEKREQLEVGNNPIPDSMYTKRELINIQYPPEDSDNISNNNMVDITNELTKFNE